MAGGGAATDRQRNMEGGGTRGLMQCAEYFLVFVPEKSREPEILGK